MLQMQLTNDSSEEFAMSAVAKNRKIIISIYSSEEDL